MEFEYGYMSWVVWNLSMDTCLGLYGICYVPYGKVLIFV